MLSKAKSLKYHLCCALLNAPPMLIGRKTRIKILRSLGATIGDTVFVSHLTRIPYGYPNLRIESGTSIQAEEILLLDAVNIGRNTCIGRGVHLLSASHEIDSETFAHKRAPIVIGDFVYIGNGAMILPGVTVGNYAIVGAGAVVTKDVPEYAVVVGNPARVIKNRAVKEYAYSPGSNAYLR